MNTLLAGVLKHNCVNFLSVVACLLIPSLSLANANEDNLRRQAQYCVEHRNYSCAEKKWREFVKLKPNEESGRANLAIVLTRAEKHKEAITIYEQLIDEGVGSWDLFANYANSLKAQGNEDKAMIWMYRTLAVVPNLVDVRGDLAKLLLKKNRGYEALSLLASFDVASISKGANPYFVDQRISIAEAIKHRETTNNHPGPSQLVPKLEAHFYTVVSANGADAVPFLIDTGATNTTVSTEILKKLGIVEPQQKTLVSVNLADGRTIQVYKIFVPELKVGPFLLQNVPVTYCNTCEALVGQSVLERFDLATRKEGGVEFLELKLRSK